MSSWLPDERLQLASDINTAKETLEALSVDLNDAVREQVAGNPNSSIKTLKRLSLDQNEWIRERVASNPSATYDIIDDLSKDESPYVKETADYIKRTRQLDQIYLTINKMAPLLSDEVIDCPEVAIKLVRSIIGASDREIVALINMKSDGTPINFNFVSIGTINCSPASAKEIFKAALLSNAARILLVHNHLGKDIKPSKADNLVTKKLLAACEIMEIPLVDHVICSGFNENVYSYLKEKELDLNEINYPEYIAKLQLKTAGEKIVEKTNNTRDDDIIR